MANDFCYKKQSFLFIRIHHYGFKFFDKTLLKVKRHLNAVFWFVQNGLLILILLPQNEDFRSEVPRVPPCNCQQLQWSSQVRRVAGTSLTSTQVTHVMSIQSGRSALPTQEPVPSPSPRETRQQSLLFRWETPNRNWVCFQSCSKRFPTCCCGEFDGCKLGASARPTEFAAAWSTSETPNWCASSTCRRCLSAKGFAVWHRCTTREATRRRPFLKQVRGSSADHIRSRRLLPNTKIERNNS